MSFYRKFYSHVPLRSCFKVLKGVSNNCLSVVGAITIEVQCNQIGLHSGINHSTGKQCPKLPFVMSNLVSINMAKLEKIFFWWIQLSSDKKIKIFWTFLAGYRYFIKVIMLIYRKYYEIPISLKEQVRSELQKNGKIGY